MFLSIYPYLKVWGGVMPRWLWCATRPGDHCHGLWGPEEFQGNVFVCLFVLLLFCFRKLTLVMGWWWVDGADIGGQGPVMRTDGGLSHGSSWGFLCVHTSVIVLPLCATLVSLAVTMLCSCKVTLSCVIPTACYWSNITASMFVFHRDQDVAERPKI